MRWLCAFGLCCGLLAGCARNVSAPVEFPGKGGVTRPPKPATNSPPAIITPGGVLPGKVVLVNPEGRFVVLSFPLGAMPARNQKLHVYREGLKVGEIRITGPHRDQNTVADILAGETQPGDEVRPE